MCVHGETQLEPGPNSLRATQCQQLELRKNSGCNELVSHAAAELIRPPSTYLLDQKVHTRDLNSKPPLSSQHSLLPSNTLLRRFQLSVTSQ